MWIISTEVSNGQCYAVFFSPEANAQAILTFDSLYSYAIAKLSSLINIVINSR